MKVIKLTESDLKHIIRRVIQTEQEDETQQEDTNTLMALRDFVRGKITKDDLYDIDDTIEDISVRNPLGQTILTIKFDNSDDVGDMLGLSDDDLWFYKILFSYDGYDFMDSYQVKEDFLQGYGVWDDINDENREKLKEIGEVIVPDKPFQLDSDEYRIQLNELLLELFDKEMDWILGDYQTEKDYEMNKTAKEHITKEFNDVLESLGIEIVDDYDLNEFEISIADLYSNVLQSNLFNENAKEMLVNIIKKRSPDMGGWYGNHYEYLDQNNFDSKSYNQTVERRLDKIIEKLGDGGVADVNKYIDLKNSILKKYKQGVWYNLPRDPETKFRVYSFDPEELKVIVQVMPNGNTPIKTIDLSEENFNNFLHQNSLFDFEETY
jgi:hypothetical protein